MPQLKKTQPKKSSEVLKLGKNMVTIQIGEPRTLPMFTKITPAPCKR